MHIASDETLWTMWYQQVKALVESSSQFGEFACQGFMICVDLDMC